MGNQYHTIVPDKIHKNEVNEVVEKTVNYLINKKIIISDKSDCILSNDLGYPPGVNYAQIVEEAQDKFFEYKINGLEIQINRQVFHSNWLDEIKCPNCGNNIINLDWSFFLDEWHKGTEKHIMMCPDCRQTNSIVDYVFEPAWAFGEVGFTFWNWGSEFKESFIKDIENLIGHTVKVVYGSF